MSQLKMPSDGFRSKGAVEQESPDQQGNTSLTGQLGHRNKDPIIGSQDSDFPEPGGNPEYTGENYEVKFQLQEEPEIEREENPEHIGLDQDPGERQKENQNLEKDDPLAA